MNRRSKEEDPNHSLLIRKKYFSKSDLRTWQLVFDCQKCGKSEQKSKLTIQENSSSLG